MNDTPRTYIGRSATASMRELVYETPEGLEVQATDQSRVSQRRVLFEEVVLVTHHREFGKTFLIVVGVAAALFLIPAAIAAVRGSTEVAYTLLTFAAPFLLMFLTRVVFRVDVVTVIGRRSKATVRFTFRKRRARELYEHLGVVVAGTQREAREETAAEVGGAVAVGEDRPPEPPREEMEG